LSTCHIEQNTQPELGENCRTLEHAKKSIVKERTDTIKRAPVKRK